MNAALQALFALLAALTASSGTPAVNPANVPAKSIVASSPAGIQATQSITPTSSVEITGTIQSITGTNIILADGTTVVVSSNTEVEVKLETGATIKIEGKLLSDGTIIASEIQSQDKSLDDGKPETEKEHGTEVEKHDDQGSHVESGDDKGSQSQVSTSSDQSKGSDDTGTSQSGDNHKSDDHGDDHKESGD